MEIVPPAPCGHLSTLTGSSMLPCMWKYSFFLPILLLTTAVTFASPERTIYSVERLLGSNEGSYTVLRTVWDNRGSHYTRVTEQTLIRYAKNPQDEKLNALGPELSRKLLLTTTWVDASVTESGKPSLSIGQRDDSVSLASILAEQPMMTTQWPADKVAKLEVQSTSGVYLGPASLIWGGDVKERFGVDRNAKHEWRLTGVSEDGNCLYLHVREATEDAPSERIIGLSTRTSKQIQDHLQRQPMYIVAGRFENLEDAMTHARNVTKVTGHVLGHEVWSMQVCLDKWVYVVCDVNSTDHLENPGFAAIEQRTGLQLEVIPGEKLWERFEVNRLAPDDAKQ